MQIEATALTEWLVDGDELAILDAREQGVFLHSHLFHAACIPLSRLELLLPTLVPRADTRIVWCDDGADDADLANRAAARSRELGFTNVATLTGGTAAWAASGGELYSGVNVPSKAFGEFVEHTYGTPRIPAAELQGLVNAGTDLVILDSRPIEEFRNMSIPGGVDCPGAELVHRVKEMAPDPDTLVVVNCAGRTRSIIGSQSLINAGLENRVVALENGTMGWELAGLDVHRGLDLHAPDPGAEARAWSEAAVQNVARRFGVRSIDHAQLAIWQSERDRTTRLIDVRTPDEYAAGHLPGSINAPGGQLIQATDEYIATRHARLVLIDDNGVRATMTASWLRQLGFADAVVLGAALDGQNLVTGRAEPGTSTGAPTISVEDLAARLDAGTGDVTVLDVDSSLKYRSRGHIPGAWWGIRSRLDEAHAAIGDPAVLVLTSSDGLLAEHTVADAATEWPSSQVLALAGGNKAWRHGSQPMDTGFNRPTTEANDVWYKPYDHDEEVAAQHMQDYLDWEIALVDQIERDPTVHFAHFPAT